MADSLSEQVKRHVELTNNPHGLTSKKILGLDRLDNTGVMDKPINIFLQTELDKKIDKSDVYDASVDDSTKDLTKMVWSAKEAKDMADFIKAYNSQDTSEQEQKLAWCEQNV